MHGYAANEQATPRLGRAGACAFFVCAAIAWIALHVALVPYLVEDSYIHFRVAQNFAQSGHPYFNVGSAVKTSSSTPWTWLLGALFALAPQGVALVVAVSACISLAGAVVWVALLATIARRRLAAWEGALAASVYLAIVQPASVAAMETGLSLLFASLGMRQFARREPNAFLWLALAAMTRLELSVLCIACAALALFTRALPWKRCVFWAACGLVPFALFDWWQYGTLVPQAFVAKRILHRVPPVAAFSLLLPEAVSSEFYFRSAAYSAYATVCVAVATLPLGRIAWSWRRLHEPAPQLLLASSATGIAIAFTYVASRGLVFPWYRPLYFSFLFLSGLVGAALSARRLPYVALLASAAPFFYEIGTSAAAALGRPESARHFLEGARAKHTLAVAAELYREYPGAVAMTSEIGAVGFGFRGRIEDGAGLASPRALSYYPLQVPSERYNSADAPVPLRFLEDVRPGLVIAVDRHLDSILAAPVRAEYVHIRKRLYDEDDDARRSSEMLLWDNIRALDVLIRKDLWEARKRVVRAP
ncbi:MAG TPA: hypothetical protein VG937_35480 [Polyangiaceae bacterium]|nr:hypothetical protein [Polyangiaceae bacterium]